MNFVFRSNQKQEAMNKKCRENTFKRPNYCKNKYTMLNIVYILEINLKSNYTIIDQKDIMFSKLPSQLNTVFKSLNAFAV